MTPRMPRRRRSWCWPGRRDAIRRVDSVASWLYGVGGAGRGPGPARRRPAPGARAPRRGGGHGDPSGRSDERGGAEAWPELYEELGRLPDRFRLPLLLCHLEGLSYEQAAQRLGCPVRTVQSRLARGREQLRDRLARRGVGPDGRRLAGRGVPARCRVGVHLSEAWKQATVTAAVRYAAGGTAAALISASRSPHWPKEPREP